MSDCIIQIDEYKSNGYGRRTAINLTFLADKAGKKERDPYSGSYRSAIRWPVIKSLLRLIARRAEPDDLAKADEFIRDCKVPKMKEIWADERKRSGSV